MQIDPDVPTVTDWPIAIVSLVFGVATLLSMAVIVIYVVDGPLHGVALAYFITFTVLGLIFLATGFYYVWNLRREQFQRTQ